MRRAAGVLLAGATSRLLPPSIPFRFFAAAVAYHVLAWIVLVADAPSVPRFSGGLGWPLAALHLATLGVLVMTAIGASLQLLPVATRQPIRSQRVVAAIWWVYTPGVAAIALGMGIPSPMLLAGGSVAALAGLAGYAVLLARNLLGARGMPVVVAHGWIAVASLLVVLATALSLACAYVGAPGLERGAGLALHVTFAGYGFMGMLALGLSYILVPMFALSEAAPERRALTSCALAALALALAGAAAFGVAPRPLRIAAIGAGGLAVALHVHMMASALRNGLRRELGRSFRLVRTAWALLIASLATALAITLDMPFEGMTTLFGVALIAGWLLTFVLGILQRIVPFLASMHAARGKGLPPTPSALTAERPLTIHFRCHLSALVLLVVAVAMDNALVAGAAAMVGATGAIAFAWFFLVVLRRMRRPRNAAAVGVPGAA